MFLQALTPEDAVKRFTHIDATFVSTDCLPGRDTAEFVVRLYPWWEHPSYLKARETNMPWGFSDTQKGAREVRVVAHSVREVKLSQMTEVIDWDFVAEHPALWRYESNAEIFINSEFDRKELFARLEKVRPPFVDLGDIAEWSAVLSSHSAPFSLGYFPRSVFRLVKRELIEMGVRVHIQREPEPSKVPQMFLIDGSDYVIADRFEVLVPRFEHRAEWFSP